MGLFSRARPAAARIEPTLAAPAERRDALDYGPGWTGLASLSGSGGMSARLSEGLATVVACTNAVASGLSALPVTAYRANGAGRVEIPTDPVARLLRAPNPRQTWCDWCEFTVAQVLLQGNALSVIERDGAGRPTGLVPVPWGCVAVQVLPSGRLAYDVVMTAAPYGGPAVSRRFLEGEVFHLRDRSDDGIVGRSRLSRAPDVLASAIGLATFASAIWQNAATPNLAITLPRGIKDSGIRRIEAHWNERSVGPDNARKVLFLDPDQAVTQISVSPEDAEVLESRKFSTIELCRLFNVPPQIVHDLSHSSFSNSSQASIFFATNTLTPWARKIEAEFSRSVIDDPAIHIELDLSGLLRGDYATRWAANVAAVNAGILTAEEVRAQEGYGPAAPAAPEAPAP